MTIVVVGAVCALIGSLWIWAAEIDKSSREREENYVRSGLMHLAETQARLMAPMTIWNEAVNRTVVKFDHQFVADNYGSYFSEYLNYEQTFVLDGLNRPVLAWEGKQETSLSAYNRLSGEITRLSKDLRERHYVYTASGIGFTSKTNAIARLTVLDGHVYLLGASLILPDSTRQDLARYTPYLVVGVHRLSYGELAALSQGHLLSTITELRSGQNVQPGSARAVFTDSTGQEKAELTWQPSRPGLDLFMRALIPSLLVSAGLGGVALALLHRSQKTARSLIASEARAKHMALHDGLTGLPNRTLFTDRLNQATERLRRQGGSVAVMCVGLDRFKDVNDTLGHSAGDELIRHSAQKIGSMIRAGDTLARLGGDVFVIIQTDTDAHSAAALAKRVLEGLKGQVTLESGPVYSSCSIGVTLLQESDIEAAEALRQADLALYRAKEQGRSQYAFFEIEMDATIKLRKLLETGLREAIHVEAIDVVYQPQVDHNGRIVGVEALARWSHPQRGPISPAYFVPLAEECGLMMDLGTLIMRRALIDSKRWPGLKVAINVSATQLRSSRFLPELKDMLRETGVEPRSIEIEITEGMLLNDDQPTQNTLNALRQMGFSIALDDFGTGYSSLSYLSRYPVDKIKIDRSFVSNLGVDPDAEALIRAIIKLAKALHLSILAEGVETQAQSHILRQAGCAIIQGYLFSKPVDRSEIDIMMEGQATSQVTHITNGRYIAGVR
ncbi:putative bifunctional diguanylate cyclase/phosphodiesterase [Asticcacaulis sp.]|uniref:putative bifunctional diguanylate cyclase/phosphodiesterase n=1 Tax=unclassified Asticcacaulis TaxID=2628350 RepID=UPI0025BEF641|nr:EAL domain-containing protein [Asticcacaulis sp.]MCA1935370.1 EAL domain-containing protein [Asticcacaulis sp.]